MFGIVPAFQNKKGHSEILGSNSSCIVKCLIDPTARPIMYIFQSRKTIRLLSWVMSIELRKMSDSRGSGWLGFVSIFAQSTGFSYITCQ